VDHVAHELSPEEITLFHALLAKLPCREIITTSQDAVFERCAKMVDGSRVCLSLPSLSFYNA